MGMKSNSNHFKGTNGAKKHEKMVKHGALLKLNIQLFAELPKNNSQLNHLFRNGTGHLIDTPENRKLIIDLTEDMSNYVGNGVYNTMWFSKTTLDGQLWASVRNGIVQDCGINKTHKKYIEGKGIKSDGYYKIKEEK